MKRFSLKTETELKIKNFFKKEVFTQEEVRKIKKRAMAYKIKLGYYRKQFCRKCLSQLRGKIRVKKGIKSVECSGCGFVNRRKI